MTREQQAARLFALADRLEFADARGHLYGLDVPAHVQERCERLRDRATVLVEASE